MTVPLSFGGTMDSIKVDKAKLLDKLRENRAKHSDQFTKAAAGYRAKVIEVLEERLTEARSGKSPNLQFYLPLPIDQTKAYDRVIGMLEMSLDDVIELEEQEYQKYVMDEWSWSAQATTTNTMYTTSH